MFWINFLSQAIGASDISGVPYIFNGYQLLYKQYDKKLGYGTKGARKMIKMPDEVFEAMLEKDAAKNPKLCKELSIHMHHTFKDRLEQFSTQEGFLAAVGKDCTNKFLDFCHDLDDKLTPERKDVVLTLMKDMYEEQRKYKIEHNLPVGNSAAMLDMIMNMMGDIGGLI